MKKIILLVVLSFGFLQAQAAQKKPVKPATRTVAAVQANASVGQCSLITLESLAENDHACTGTWMATRSDDKILFCCQIGAP